MCWSVYSLVHLSALARAVTQYFFSDSPRRERSLGMEGGDRVQRRMQETVRGLHGQPWLLTE